MLLPAARSRLAAPARPGFTSPGFTDDLTEPNGTQNGGQARLVTVTLRVEVVAGTGDLRCAMHPSVATLADAAAADLILHDGKATLAIGPL